LTSIDVSAYRQLKVLRVDRNLNIQVKGIDKIRELEVLTIRGQKLSKDINSQQELVNGSVNMFDMADWTPMCDIRVLRFSGNAISRNFPMKEPFMNLHVLDLSGVALSHLPMTLGELCVNLRELDLSFNNISDIEPLISIPKLERLYLFHNKLDDMEQVVEVLLGMSYLIILDLRDNPVAHDLYPPVFNEDQLELPYLAYRQSRTSIKRHDWFQRDLEYKYQLRRIEPELYNRRLLYQATVLASLLKNGKALQFLDGIEFDFKTQQQLLMDASAAKM
jgi:Leucine Rich repeats (2 copies)